MIPKPKINELLGQIEKAFYDGKRDEFTITRFKSEATKLLKSNPAEAYQALGLIAALQGNIDSIHAQFKNAIRLSPSDPMAWGNYGTSLARVGLFAKAVDCFCKVIELLPDDLVTISHIIPAYNYSGQFFQVKKWINEWNRLQPHSIFESDEFVESVESITLLMKERHIEESALKQLIELTMAILHENHIYVSGDDVKIFLSEEESGYVYVDYWIYLPPEIDVETTVQLNFTLADRTVEECPPEIIRGGFVPLYIATDKQRSLLELEGLGAEIWQGINAQDYVNQLRQEWD